MNRVLALLLCAALVPAPAMAQHVHQHGDEGAAAPADPHAGHRMPMPEEPAPDPHAGHALPATPFDPPVAPPPPEALSGPENAADRLWSPDAMARARQVMAREHGRSVTTKVMVDRLEAQSGNGPDGWAAEAQAWHGGDIDKLWLKADLHGRFDDGIEEAELQALWSRAIDPWFDLQAGLRYDARRGPDRAHLALGVQGLAPWWIDVDAAAFVSDRGDITARIEAEHDVRITRKLTLQPRLEAEFAAQDIGDEGIGSGLSTASVGLRLRYEFSPRFAPYVGVEHARAFGDTRRLRRAAGESAAGTVAVAGVRMWF